VKQGERKLRKSLRRLKQPKPRRWPRIRELPQLTPGQWFRLALLFVGIVAALLGIETDWLSGLVELLVK